jgi:hypothetical protein
MAITDQMIEQYQHPRIKLVVGNTTIYENDIVSGSFSYRGGTTGSGAFAPGGCVISSCSFTVYNRTGSYTNTFAEKTEVQVYIGYGATPQSATYDLLCTACVAEATKRNYKIAVQCYDKLRDADKKKWSTYNFPMTVNEIIQSAATEAGITVNQLPPNTVPGGGGISVDLRDSDGNQPDLSMTCRQAIAQALLISGHYGYMTPAGQLYCGWYNASVDKTIPTKWIFDYNVTDAQDYTGVQVYGQTPFGTDTRLYVLSSGRFITEDNCAAIQGRLYLALVSSGLSIRKGTFSMVCNPNVRPGMVIQTTVPQAGSNVTITIPLTSVTVKGSLKATYSSENISADEMDDLRKPDTVTQEDLEKALKDISGGGDDGCEWIKLPLSKIYMKASSSMVNSFETFRGFTLELDKQDNYHSNITQLIARNPSNSEQDQDGIDVYKVFYPDQYVRVPAINDTGRWIELWVGQIIQPSLNDYRDVYGHSFTEARRQARLCNFCSTNTQPARVRIYVQRFKGENYDYLSFGADPSDTGDFSTTDPIRPRVLYNGLQLLDTMPDHMFPPNPRIPYVRFYFPGQCYDLFEANTTTYHKWCYRHGQTETGELELIPAYYFYS